MEWNGLAYTEATINQTDHSNDKQTKTHQIEWNEYELCLMNFIVKLRQEIIISPQILVVD